MKSIKTVLAALGVVALMTGCSDNQTSFDVEDVPGKALVQGTIVYNQGATLQDNKFVYEYKPAANLEVIITVDNSSYDSNLKGETVFTTTTDENGKYSIEIPAPANECTVDIRTAQFLGTHSTVQRVNNKIEAVEKNVVYWAKGHANVISKGYYYADLECVTFDTETEFSNYTETATLSGVIGRNAEFYIAPERRYNEDNELIGIQSASVRNCYVPAPNADLMIQVTYEGKERTYNATTDSKGEFSINVPVKEFPASFSYTVEIMPQTNATYEHYVAVDKTVEYNEREFTYTDYEVVKMNGWYAQYISGNNNSGVASYPVASVTQSFELKALIFRAQQDVMSENNYYPSQFETSLPWKTEIEEELKEANENL